MPLGSTSGEKLESGLLRLALCLAALGGFLSEFWQVLSRRGTLGGLCVRNDLQNSRKGHFHNSSPNPPPSPPPNPTQSCGQAIKGWEAKNEAIAEEAEVVKLFCQIPPITKLDNSLNTLKNCEQVRRPRVARRAGSEESGEEGSQQGGGEPR